MDQPETFPSQVIKLYLHSAYIQSGTVDSDAREQAPGDYPYYHFCCSLIICRQCHHHRNRPFHCAEALNSFPKGRGGRVTSRRNHLQEFSVEVVAAALVRTTARKDRQGAPSAGCRGRTPLHRILLQPSFGNSGGQGLCYRELAMKSNVWSGP